MQVLAEVGGPVGRVAVDVEAGRGALRRLPSGGALVEAVDVELVDHEPAAGAHDLGQALARRDERLDVVQRDHRHGGGELSLGGVESARATGSTPGAPSAAGSIATTS